MGKAQREKGKRGERELAAINRDLGFSDSRRGQQFHGGGDSPDVTGVPGIHLEVKRVEKLMLWPSLDQAGRDSADDEIPVVAHRPNGRDWIAILDYRTFMGMYKELLDLREAAEAMEDDRK